MKLRTHLKLALCLVPFLAGAAYATTISYEVSNVSGSRWEYAYTVTNDSMGAPIDEFTVYFDPASYANLAVGAAPSGWENPQVTEPGYVLGVPVDGFYDALASSTGILPGNSLGEFFVRFDWLGTGTPGSQKFDVVDPNTFEVLNSGDTTRADPVPEPGTLVLLGSGLAGLWGRFRRAKART